MKILIVEDKTEDRYLLETLLKGSGYEVVSTGNGAEALEKLRGGNFDIIISDILMPVMDGFQLCRKVKMDKNMKEIPFIFYTATYTDEKDEELALQMGADRFIRKPVEPDEFIKIIQGVIEDMEKGRIEPGKPVVEEEKDIFKLYSERLVNKLEKKMLDLEREITDRKRAEGKARQSLKEKEVLLSEIHHRVKNNMQIISSLLNLQAGFVEDERTLELFKECQNRIRAMALIHERLYQAKDLASIDFAVYIRNLMGNLLSVYRIDPDVIKLNFYVDDVFLDINTAIPCGLIINELVSNAFKHALPEVSKGEVSITLTEDKVDKRHTLIVSDDGVSFPEDLDFRDTETFGMRLVNILTKQLHGTIELDRSSGTSFKIVF